MRVGLITRPASLASLERVYRDLARAVGANHEVRSWPVAVPIDARPDEMPDRLVAGVDALVGVLDPAVLEARARIGSRVPYLLLLQGHLTRGGHDLLPVAHLLRSTDVLVGNCSADLEVTRRVFANARVGLVPYAVDPEEFYRYDPSRRRQVREARGIGPQDRVLAYAGRISLEKNLLATLRIFRVLCDVVDGVRLVVAGPISNNPFRESGVHPIDLRTTLQRAIDRLGLPAERVHFLRGLDGPGTRDLYNLADVFVNMTLHHDENFGYGQVEAMLCSTPVVGTSWGGLKDTIAHGVGGYQVSSALTESGVKVNWWEAADRIAAILLDADLRARLGEDGRLHARERFSLARMQEALEALLQESTRDATLGEPLRTTELGSRLWGRHGQRRPLSPLPYPTPLPLYRELIAPYAGLTEGVVARPELDDPGLILVLAQPVELFDHLIKVVDPLYPLDITLPPAVREPVRQLMVALIRAPASRAVDLPGRCPGLSADALAAAVAWSSQQGLLFATRSLGGHLQPRAVGPALGVPLFRSRPAEVDDDLVVVR